MRTYLFALFLLLPLFSTAQEEEKPRNWTLSGYVKDLQAVYLLHTTIPILNIDTTFVSQTSFLHNRLNFKWIINDAFTFKTDLRTRAFWGDDLNDAFIDNLDQANDYFDLSYGATNNNGLAFHTMIDRLYLQLNKGKWEVRLGRQRINWGINALWNPNDIFNAFAFTDFDYEERPGSDALRVKYYTGFASSIEIAAKAADSWETATGALLWKLNKWNYDFQVLAGIAQNELVFGGGWAGGIKGLGFKGEFSYFSPLDEAVDQTFTGTFSLSYVTSKSFFLNAGYLYNSNGMNAGSLLNLFNFQLSAKNLYPYQHSVFVQGSYPFTPLLNGSLAIIYSPSKAQALFVNPTITYSIANNWDLDLIGQIAFNEDDGFRSPLQGLFLR
ncbi:MAG: hypothetical protein KDC44_11065, partial [Phaeodactylibacter sp.]|nr:hypothetical protein [Phaeodactylibacter sp.]